MLGHLRPPRGLRNGHFTGQDRQHDPDLLLRRQRRRPHHDRSDSFTRQDPQETSPATKSDARHEEHNAESHGHGWEGLAESLVRSRMPDNADKLHFGSEAGTFVVSSSDLKALTDLALLLHSAFHNRELLSQYIVTADPRFLNR
ncbi:Imm51 family immunity protein [Kitasatospora sp. NPDC085879]|uniref:Imm51 family immunity protein n=1 Tax=Kitasatospora sp. NPDC085879 TaxID=3154769 RepID=UPI00344200B7